MRSCNAVLIHRNANAAFAPQIAIIPAISPVQLRIFRKRTVEGLHLFESGMRHCLPAAASSFLWGFVVFIQQVAGADVELFAV